MGCWFCKNLIDVKKTNNQQMNAFGDPNLSLEIKRLLQLW